ncbi:MAG: RNase adaptor protein RapZ, partial [Clostridia bacterium]|nr:RNase adaptor protein RapZ [Clostridia bacterium]
EGIARERELLSDIRGRADYVLDTSGLLTRQLKEQVLSFFEKKETFENISINVVSFGFKYGIPLDSDLVFDVRFLPNPFYESDLKEHTGLEQEVQEFVLRADESQEFLKKLEQLFLFLLPQYIKEGKTQLVVAIGCTGGKHRSVTVAEQLAKSLLKHRYFAVANHRDIKK